MIRIAAFLLISIALLGLSRNCLRSTRVHGFYRFFALESVLIVVLLNAPAWFDHPGSPRQLLSWALLLGSAILPLHGFHLLRTSGAPRGRIEDTTRLVTRGVYRYIRHPLYSSLLSVAWAVFFKNPSRLGGILALAATVFLVVTARVEEAECVRFFGPAYQEYMARTKMFVPLLF